MSIPETFRKIFKDFLKKGYGRLSNLESSVSLNVLRNLDPD